MAKLIIMCVTLIILTAIVATTVQNCCRGIRECKEFMKRLEDKEDYEEWQ